MEEAEKTEEAENKGKGQEKRYLDAVVLSFGAVALTGGFAMTSSEVLVVRIDPIVLPVMPQVPGNHEDGHTDGRCPK